MTTTNHFNTRLAIRNLVIVTVLSLAYLFGKHLQVVHNTHGFSSLKIKCTNNQTSMP